MTDRYSGLERTALQPRTAPAHGQPSQPGRLQVAQSQLVSHGFPIAHAPNGQLTPSTMNALKAFQSKRGLTPTGTLDQRTTAALAKPPATTGRTVGSRRMRGGPILVHAGPSSATHLRSGVTRAPTSPTSSANPQPTAGASNMNKNGVSWESAGKRVPIIFQSNGTVAAGATQTIPVQPQVAFRGENFVVDAVTAAFFSIVSFKVGVPDQNAGGSGNIPCSIYAANQNGAIDYEMDLADSGTIIQLTVINNDTAAHLFVGTLWGHEIKQAG